MISEVLSCNVLDNSIVDVGFNKVLDELESVITCPVEEDGFYEGV